MATGTDLLVVEYERCSEYCNHVDDVRNILTSFFLTVCAGTVVGLTRYASGELKTAAVVDPQILMAVVCIGVAVIGALFTASLARLRRIQLQRYRIMNAVLDHLLSSDERTLVPHSNATLVGGTAAAVRSRTSGTYFWTLIVIVPSATMAGLAVALLTGPGPFDRVASAAAAAMGLVVLLVLDRLHSHLSVI
jgi:hypothetical protein